MSSFNYKGSGIGNAAAYQVSAVPFVSSSIAVATGSVTEIEFPSITSMVTIRNDGSNELRFGFSENGVQGTNYVPLSSSWSYSADFKVNKVFLVSDGGPTAATVIAGLTSIPVAPEFNNWTGSAGVG